MTAPATKNFNTLVSDFIAAVQAASSQLIDSSVGSILRAVAQASGGVGLWMQGMILRLLLTTRLSTSTGGDVDSWVADFGLTRLAGVAATGTVTFGRSSTTNAALIPNGSTASTSDGSQDFTVYADATNPAYSAADGGYVIGAGVASVDVPVRAVNIGVQGNVIAGAITVLKTGISGVDTVTNNAKFTTGINEETDAALRERFVLFINALAKGTEAAIGYAVTSIQQGMEYTIAEGEHYDGTAEDGFFCVVVDDGSGAVSDSLLAQCQAAVEGVRAAGVRYSVHPASLLSASVIMQMSYNTGYYAPDVIAAVTAALTAYIDGVGLGNPVYYTKLEQVAYEASPGVANVVSVALNGQRSDLTPAYKQTVKVGTLVVS